MLDDTRARAWEREARALFSRFYATDNPAWHMAAVVLVLLADREERERYCARVQAGQPLTMDDVEV